MRGDNAATQAMRGARRAAGTPQPASAPGSDAPANRFPREITVTTVVEVGAAAGRCQDILPAVYGRTVHGGRYVQPMPGGAGLSLWQIAPVAPHPEARCPVASGPVAARAA